MKHQDIINSLPLLAAVLGKKYGVTVEIGGDTASTNGNVITLPALPLEADDVFIGLLRGYLDHEAAHIRATDFHVLREKKPSELQKYIWNILEDWRVEHKLSMAFPGCKENFNWLIRHLFLNDTQDAEERHGPFMILQYILFTVRSWDVACLQAKCNRFMQGIEPMYPGLLGAIDALLMTAQHVCINTECTLELAEKIVEVIKKYIKQAENNNAVAGIDSIHSSGFYNDHQAQNTSGNILKIDKQPNNHEESQDRSSIERLKILVNVQEGELPVDMGIEIAGQLQTLSTGINTPRHNMARVLHRSVNALSTKQVLDSRQSTVGMRTRLQALLQSMRPKPTLSSCHGRVSTHKLARAACCSSNIFMRAGQNVGLNTAVHILMDCSGSMSGEAIELASSACFGICSALHGTPGISVGATAFPGGIAESGPYSERERWHTVNQVLQHGLPMHNNFLLQAEGPTPMGEALWWVVQHVYHLKQKRKIILLVTDGFANNAISAQNAINSGIKSGFEIYGIGIGNHTLGHLLDSKKFCTINHVAELAPAMFRILQPAILKLAG